MVCYWKQLRSPRQRSRDLLSTRRIFVCHVASNVFIWDSCLWSGCLFEMDALAIKIYQVLKLQKRKKKNQDLHYNPPCGAEASESMMRTWNTWVADMLKVRSRACCNPESTHLHKSILANSIIIIPAVVWNLEFHGSSAGKESSGNAGDAGSIPGSGRSAREGIDHPL